MLNKFYAAKDLSYAHSVGSKGGQTVINLLENATGRLALIKRARGYQDEIAKGRDFWQVIVERYGLSLDIMSGSLTNIPRAGPLILVANHPFGILDGVILGHILATIRGDFRILAHKVFQKSEELQSCILSVSFDKTKEAMRQNLDTRKEALEFLTKNGAIGIFPSGTVSTARKPFTKPMDPRWRNFTARMITKSNATVVPIYFDGQNSRMFQIASHAHYTLRMGLLMKEFRKRIDSPVKLAIGAAITPQELKAQSCDATSLMDYLRCTTYELAPAPFEPYEYGFEFEDHYKRPA